MRRRPCRRAVISLCNIVLHHLVRHTALLRRLSSHSAHSAHFPFSNRFLEVPIKKTLHKADCVLYPVTGRKDKVVIALSGSEGGLEHAEKLAQFLQDNGIPALALGYFKTKHSVKTLRQYRTKIVRVLRS